MNGALDFHISSIVELWKAINPGQGETFVALAFDAPRNRCSAAQMLQIVEDDLNGEPTRALVALHLAGARSLTPPEYSFALDLSELQVPEITFWSVWDGPALAGIGALKMLGDDMGEVKSMRTDPDHLRKGVAAALLNHIIAEARLRGLRRLSLETGTGHGFAAAVALYRKHGFLDGGPFADYSPSPYNQFLHLDLD
jgi:putative acetyltransferase